MDLQPRERTPVQRGASADFMTRRDLEHYAQALRTSADSTINHALAGDVSAGRA